MAIPYTILERKNNISENRNTHYFLKLLQNHTVDLDTLCKEIEKETALSEVEVYAVLLALQSKIKQHLENGDVVDLAILGKFSMAAKTFAHANKADVSIHDVQKFHINFMPSAKLKQWLKQKFKLTKHNK